MKLSLVALIGSAGKPRIFSKIFSKIFSNFLNIFFQPPQLLAEADLRRILPNLYQQPPFLEIWRKLHVKGPMCARLKWKCDLAIRSITWTAMGSFECTTASVFRPNRAKTTEKILVSIKTLSPPRASTTNILGDLMFSVGRVAQEPPVTTKIQVTKSPPQAPTQTSPSTKRHKPDKNREKDREFTFTILYSLFWNFFDFSFTTREKIIINYRL